MKAWFWLFMVALALSFGGCSSSVRDTSRSFTTVVIDAGHGGHDSGATSRYAGREKDLALDVALRLQPKLQAAGFQTVMTRSNDTFIPLDTRASISNRQSNALFVSIHFNDAPRSGPSGSEVYYKSRVSARTAQNILSQVGSIPGNYSRGTKTANFRVLKRATFPAVLVECGFVSNPSEGRRCAQGGHREALATAIARGLIIQRHGSLDAYAAAVAPTPAASPAVTVPPSSSANPALATEPTPASKPGANPPKEKKQAQIAKPNRRA
jgi:N-acetylmuramoyl-L-alanine amidase